jgi:hypothetical protein
MDTHLGQTSRIKEKQRIKEYSYVEQTCSNIVVQSTDDDHTNYMVRARPKCKIGREATEYWSASNLI